MQFFDLKNIAERHLRILDPTTPEKILELGEVLGINEKSKVIDFGTGYGELPALWGKKFGMSCVGIDIREHAVGRARKRIEELGLADHITFACADVASYPFEEGVYDAALCIGATFIWGGFRETIRAMKNAIHPKGALAIGEVIWKPNNPPADLVKTKNFAYTEMEIFRIAREEGFNIKYMVRSTTEDFDHYEASNWRGLVDWLEENPDHPEREDVEKHLLESQEEYFSYGRWYFGWAMYILTPATSRV